MQHLPNLSETLTAFHSDLNRIQTMAGTLSQLDRQHYNDLTKYDDERLTGIAVAEQNSSGSLGNQTALSGYGPEN